MMFPSKQPSIYETFRVQHSVTQGSVQPDQSEKIPLSSLSPLFSKLHSETDTTSWADPVMTECKPLVIISDLDNMNVTAGKRTDQACTMSDQHSCLEALVMVLHRAPKRLGPALHIHTFVFKSQTFSLHFPCCI